MSDQHKELRRSPPDYEVLRLMAAGTLGAALLGLSSLTFAGTVIFLVLAAPFLVLFSPILVPAVITLILSTAGFLFSVGSGLGGLAAMFWLYRKAHGQHVMRIASKAWDMKERAKEGEQFVQNKALENAEA
ncbi:unnamed protein product [Withania somnifera]